MPSRISNAFSIAEFTTKLRGPRARHGRSVAACVIVRPVRATVSADVTSISPPRAISLLNRALGVTAEQHVSFGPDLRGGTRVRMTMDLVGKSSELSESAVHEAITFFTNDTLDTVVALCRRRFSSASGQ
jgi:hypothetical protein